MSVWHGTDNKRHALNRSHK